MAELTKDDLTKEAQSLIYSLEPRKGASVVGLYGDLGAGKTTFTKALAEVLGVTETVTSPTFVIEKIYRIMPNRTPQHFTHLIHIDAYRLTDSSELKQLGWDEIVEDPHNLIIVEWADRVEDILPKDTKKLSLSVLGETTREFSYK